MQCAICMQDTRAKDAAYPHQCEIAGHRCCKTCLRRWVQVKHKLYLVELWKLQDAVENAEESGGDDALADTVQMLAEHQENNFVGCVQCKRPLPGTELSQHKMGRLLFLISEEDTAHMEARTDEAWDLIRAFLVGGEEALFGVCEDRHTTWYESILDFDGRLKRMGIAMDKEEWMLAVQFVVGEEKDYVPGRDEEEDDEDFDLDEFKKEQRAAEESEHEVESVSGEEEEEKEWEFSDSDSDSD